MRTRRHYEPDREVLLEDQEVAYDEKIVTIPVRVELSSWDRGYNPPCLALADEPPREPGYERQDVFLGYPLPHPESDDERAWVEISDRHPDFYTLVDRAVTQ